MIRQFVHWWSDLRRRSGPRVAIGVAVAVLGMVAGVVLHASQTSNPDDPKLLIAMAKRSDRAGQAQVGHLLYQVTSARLQRLPDNGDENRLIASVNVRISDVKGSSDYIDNKTFHLLVDGELLTHENNVNLTVDENSAVQTQLVFFVPDGTIQADLLIGRASEGAARIGLDLAPHRVADGS